MERYLEECRDALDAADGDPKRALRILKQWRREAVQANFQLWVNGCHDTRAHRNRRIKVLRRAIEHMRNQ